MALTKIAIGPGVQADLTEYAAEGKWFDSDKIRFRDGLPEPIGGWKTLFNGTIVGVPRALHAWAENSGSRLLAIGTSRKLYLLRGGQLFDITPVRSTGTLGTDPFTTVNTTKVVTVEHTAHGATLDDSVTFAGATAVGGITIVGEYFITEIVDVDNYKIEHSIAATSSATGGGASVTFSYQINVGPDSATAGFGWGAGTWGDSTWGTARASSSIILNLRTWSLGNWGEDLIANPRGGGIYTWDASGGAGTPATLIAAAPGEVNSIVISPEDRHLIALQADGDPMAIQWCDQDDFTDWTPGVGSTADLRRLLHGSRIVRALRTKGEILIWSDTALYSMRALAAGDFAFDIDRVGVGCSLWGINTLVEHDDAVYWMGNGSFYLYNGRIQEIQCSVLRTVFDDISRDQADKDFAALNCQWREIAFHYASASGSGEVDRYAKYNFRERVWDKGTFDRTAWVDSKPFDFPIAAASDGMVFEHENGNNADGGLIGDFIESAEFDIGDGENVMFNRRFIADFKLTGDNTLNITIKTRNYINPDEPQITRGPFTIAAGTRKTDARFRGRHATMRLAASSPESKWRMGAMRFDLQPDGKR